MSAINIPAFNKGRHIYFNLTELLGLSEIFFQVSNQMQWYEDIMNNAIKCTPWHPILNLHLMHMNKIDLTAVMISSTGHN